MRTKDSKVSTVGTASTDRTTGAVGATGKDAKDHEDQAVRQISDRLKARYVTTAPASIDAAVDSARENRRDARIRDFVTIFIERQARTTLDAAGAQATGPALDPGARTANRPRG